MKQSQSNRSLSRSFILGVIALVFLIVGYQTALFIHRAAVMRIAANRDSPDTVYVVKEAVAFADEPKDVASLPDETSGKSETIVSTKRHNASHSPRAEAVRQNLPYPEQKPFRFDPNTVSVEDLCRLGFSRKQAESIDAYRQKGGVFRRKQDFSKSYVVSDETYRRLEPYIDIPLVDLNLADSAAFDDLPGIGGWFASKIIEHREALGGYSCIEQLMDIYRFDQEKFDALKDLVCVKSPRFFPLWTLPADSLRQHPYIRNEETAKAIVLFREHNPEEQWTVDKLRDAGILSEADALRLSCCVK